MSKPFAWGKKETLKGLMVRIPQGMLLSSMVYMTPLVGFILSCKVCAVELESGWKVPTLHMGPSDGGFEALGVFLRLLRESLSSNNGNSVGRSYVLRSPCPPLSAAGCPWQWQPDLHEAGRESGRTFGLLRRSRSNGPQAGTPARPYTPRWSTTRACLKRASRSP